jgi:regulator of sirC expression with transglutaminase-like and TPR domain
MARLPDDRIDLAKAALLISRTEYPHLDESFYLGRLEDMAARLKPWIAGTTSPEVLTKEINRLLFEEEGFRGNIHNYLDPRNSFLNQVLERKLGIPISLSLVYIEVGRRAGLDVQGIGLPGHFITALIHESGRILVDPFNRGRILTKTDCRQMFVQRYGESRGFETRFLDLVGPKDILARMLRNLKAIYSHIDEDLKAFQMIEWILALDPNATNELRERGLLYEAIGDPDRAVRDLSRYLEFSPMAEDEEIIRAKIDMLKDETPLIH